MSRNRWRTAVFSALLSAISCAFAMTASASDGIRIIGESESEQQVQTADTAPSQGAAQSSSTAALAGAGGAEAQAETEADAAAEEGQRPLNPADEGITAEEAVREARSLYSQMQHYADINDNTQFAALFEDGADAQTVQDQLQAVKSSLADLKGLDSHSDLCFFDPTQDSTQSPYYFAVALCDYDVDASGAAAWYSTLMRLAKYPSGWKASVIPAENSWRGSTRKHSGAHSPREGTPWTCIRLLHCASRQARRSGERSTRCRTLPGRRRTGTSASRSGSRTVRRRASGVTAST